MVAPLKPAIRVSLDQLFLDPNNPRLAREDRPGYEDIERFLTREAQAELERQLRSRYRLTGLVGSILGAGWLPVDAIVVWEVPDSSGRYLVVEGNTRVVALRSIRRSWEQETARLRRAQARSDERSAAVSRQRVERQEPVVRASERLEVHPVQAESPAELAQQLPSLLGVRHLSHAQQWRSTAVNLYLLALYRDAYTERYRTSVLRLDEELLGRVAAGAGVSAWRMRRAVQTATAYLQFTARFESRLPAGESFSEDDQNFFARIFEAGHAHDRLGVSESDLALKPDASEVLFAWAFRLPRRTEGGPNKNILRSADDVALWNRMARYDQEKGTRFAERLDPAQPELARPMAETELEYLAHRGQQSPVDALKGLLDTMKRVEIGTLRARRDEMRPLVHEMLRLGRDLQVMLDAIHPVH